MTPEQMEQHNQERIVDLKAEAEHKDRDEELKDHLLTLGAEFGKRLAVIEYKQDLSTITLGDIKKQTTETNGRVTALEKKDLGFMEFLRGNWVILAIITPSLVGIIGWMGFQLWKNYNHEVDVRINNAINAYDVQNFEQDATKTESNQEVKTR